MQYAAKYGESNGYKKVFDITKEDHHYSRKDIESKIQLQEIEGIGVIEGIIEWLYKIGIETSEALPILLFIGIGAMIDFTPLLSRPILFLFGFAAQFGIFVAICLALKFRPRLYRLGLQ